VSGTEPTRASDQGWYDLVDPATDRVVGQVTRDGRVRSDDGEIARRVRAAFDRDLMTRDGEVAEELGVCFADIATVGPDDTAHHDLVFRNLGLLTGLVPSRRSGRHGRDG
jgi:hypothetical protein